MNLRIARTDLETAVGNAGLTPETTEKLWATLQHVTAGQQRFNAVQVLYYFGALFVILSMLTLGATQWDTLSGFGITIVAGLYATLFLGMGHFLWHQKTGLRTPGGLLIVMAVSMTPLLIYGLQKQFGIWPFAEPGTYKDFHVWVRSGWFVMEAATIIACCMVLAFYRFPFITAPIAFVLWYMSMDLTPILFDTENISWPDRRWVSLWFGLALIAIAYVIDLATRQDFSFWLYLSGLLAFWGGLSLLDSPTAFGKFLYFLINCSLIMLSVFLRRRAFMVFGVFGVIGYLSYLSHIWFQDQIMFTVALSVLGLAILGIGVLVARMSGTIGAWVDHALPRALQRLRPK